MDFLNDYVVLVILGICYCVGFILKHAVHNETLDRFIPLIMGALGIFLNVWASGWAITPSIILGGLASGLAATGTNQIFKQLTKDSDEDLETEILIAILGSGVLSTLISGLFTFLQSRRDANNATALGVKSVLQDRIKWLGRQHIKRGCVTFEDLEDLIKMHEVYHDKLKGNGYLDKVMSEVKALPVVERYEEYE